MQAFAGHQMYLIESPMHLSLLCVLVTKIQKLVAMLATRTVTVHPSFMYCAIAVGPQHSVLF